VCIYIYIYLKCKQRGTVRINVTMRCARATIFAVEEKEVLHIVSVCL